VAVYRRKAKREKSRKLPFRNYGPPLKRGAPGFHSSGKKWKDIFGYTGPRQGRVILIPELRNKRRLPS